MGAPACLGLNRREANGQEEPHASLLLHSICVAVSHTQDGVICMDQRFTSIILDTGSFKIKALASREDFLMVFLCIAA